MKTRTGTIVRACTLVAFALGIGMSVSAGCEKKTTNSPDDDGGNLCTTYSTCDECIAGQQANGSSKGAAQTECGAAVAGCWTTWEKPIVCDGKEHAGEG